jgi:hypothetical protein
MDHVAIMKKSWGLVPKIISGEKKIESRWYKNKSAPWGKIKEGDTIYFKNSGESVTASAKVSNVLQFNLQNVSDARNIVKKYGKKICLINSNPVTWGKLPRYCILKFLKNAKYLDKPFNINKNGFGTGAAWLCVQDIIKIKHK